MMLSIVQSMMISRSSTVTASMSRCCFSKNNWNRREFFFQCRTLLSSSASHSNHLYHQYGNGFSKYPRNVSFSIPSGSKWWRRGLSSRSEPHGLDMSKPPETTDEVKTSEESTHASSSSEAENATSSSSTTEVEKPRKKGRARTWNERFVALQEFKKVEGHTNVPQGHDDSGLQYFVVNIKSGTRPLTEVQIKKLNSIGFDWETREQKEEKLWQDMFQRLLDYRKEHGHTNVPAGYGEKPFLGRWVDKQRYNHSRGLLAKHRVEQLEEIGDFQWYTATVNQKSITHDKKWNHMYNKLVAFYREHGHTVVPRSYEDENEDKSLVNWVLRQRVLEKKGLLRDDRREKLEEIDFSFEVGQGKRRNQ